MRRILSITLLLLFGLPLMAPIFAMSASIESQLPACCRKAGAHHCMQPADPLATIDQATHLSAARSKCPVFPLAAATFHHDQLSIGSAPPLIAEVLLHPAQFPHVEAWARVALEGARQQRGPPSEPLSSWKAPAAER